MRYFVALCFFCTTACTMLAAPIQVGEGAFSGSATVVNFNSIANEEQIVAQYAGLGVTFSGGLYGLTNPGDADFFPAPGAAIASNWLYSQAQHGPMPITVTFSTPVLRVGFLTEVNAGDTTTIATYSGVSSTGSVNHLSSSLTAAFFGVEDLSGISSITINVTGPGNHFIALDDLRFDTGAAAQVPEPTTWLSLAGGLALLGALRRHSAAK